MAPKVSTMAPDAHPTSRTIDASVDAFGPTNDPGVRVGQPLLPSTENRPMRLVAALCLVGLLASAASGEGPGFRLRVSNPLDAARPIRNSRGHGGGAGPARPARRPVGARRRRRAERPRGAEPGRRRGRRRRLRPARVPGRLRRRRGAGVPLVPRAKPRKPRSGDYRVYGRFVRERHDDFAWENDRVAFRIYGQALETFEEEPLTSSAVDAWSKRTRRLVINDWYLRDDYHRDHGEGGDFYPAGPSRGLRRQRALVNGRPSRVSKNFRASRVLAPGPIRLVFELDYPEWETPGLEVTETKRVTLDAGSQLQPLRELLPLDRRRPDRRGPSGIRKADGRRAARRPRARRRADVGAPDQLRRQRLARLRRRASTRPPIVDDAGRRRQPARRGRATPRARPRPGTRAPAGTAAATSRTSASWDRYLDAFARAAALAAEGRGRAVSASSDAGAHGRRARSSLLGCRSSRAEGPAERPTRGRACPGSSPRIRAPVVSRPRLPDHRLRRRRATARRTRPPRFRAAIEACHAAGGGRVVVPPGRVPDRPDPPEEQRQPARLRRAPRSASAAIPRPTCRSC